MAEYELRIMPVDQIQPADYNPRVALKPGDPEYEKLRASIDDLGVIDPLVWNETTGRLVGGHQRLTVLMNNGMTEAPVFVVHLSEEKERQANIALNKISGRFDEEKLKAVLKGLSPSVVKLAGFDPKDLRPMQNDFFQRDEFDADAMEEGNDEYNEFVEKFKPRKTTDDCYTPQNVYDVLADFVADEYGRDRDLFVRPFYPGGNYQEEQYPDGCTVVDNPPFSILSEIIQYYLDEDIPFFLFAPTLSCMNILRGDRRGRLCIVLMGNKITYENGANVNTSYITNLDTRNAVRMFPEARERLEAANAENERKLHAELPKYVYPFEVLSGKAYRLCQYGQALTIPWTDCVFIREMDAQKEAGSQIYGGGLLLSERAAAERAAAERAAAERAAAERDAAEHWQLSERELEIIRSMRR